MIQENLQPRLSNKRRGVKELASTCSVLMFAHRTPEPARRQRRAGVSPAQRRRCVPDWLLRGQGRRDDCPTLVSRFTARSTPLAPCATNTACVTTCSLSDCVLLRPSCSQRRCRPLSRSANSLSRDPPRGNGSRALHPCARPSSK